MTGEKVFTAWLTSTNGVDHAVTDEAFAAQRPEPEAVCGAVIVLAPMEAPPGPHCARCAAFLAARASLRDLPQRLDPHRHRRPCWLARALRAVVPAQRTGSTPDGPGVPPTAGSIGFHEEAADA